MDHGSATSSAPVTPAVSVIIVTWRRPAHVDSCLQALARLRTPPLEVLVVDASEDHATADVVARYAHVRRLPFPAGAGHMTSARNYGLLHARGDVIAFLDDDANVRPAWLDNLLDAHEPADVGAVAGRTCDPGEAGSTGPSGSVGLLLPDGRLTGNFDVDTGLVIDVDHGIGANMSFKRAVLARLGGFRDDFPGTALREDTDIFFRVRAAGWRAVFAPGAVADHTGAPHVKGQRFDFRYVFWARHNHALLLGRNLGLGAPATRRWIVGEMKNLGGAPTSNWLRRAFRLLAGASALLLGVFRAGIKGGWSPTAAERKDAQGRQIRLQLLSQRPRRG